MVLNLHYGYFVAISNRGVFELLSSQPIYVKESSISFTEWRWGKRSTTAQLHRFHDQVSTFICVTDKIEILESNIAMLVTCFWLGGPCKVVGLCSQAFLQMLGQYICNLLVWWIALWSNHRGLLAWPLSRLVLSLLERDDGTDGGPRFEEIYRDTAHYPSFHGSYSTRLV